MFISLRSASRPRYRREPIVPTGTCKIAAAFVAHAFETDQKNDLALILRSCPSARSNSGSWRDAVGSVVATRLCEQVSRLTVVLSRIARLIWPTFDCA